MLIVQLIDDDTSRPTLYYDLGSPYAHLAVARAGAVLGVEPRLRAVLVGGIFVERGFGSWSQTAERERRIAEIEERARRYGLPPVAWPDGWPNNTLKAMRAATWAEGEGLGDEFARVGFERAFGRGRDLSRIEEAIDIATAIGLSGEEAAAAIEDPTVKDRLREATARAWELGVVGVPCLELRGTIHYGDDRLEQAAAVLEA